MTRPVESRVRMLERYSRRLACEEQLVARKIGGARREVAQAKEASARQQTRFEQVRHQLVKENSALTNPPLERFQQVGKVRERVRAESLRASQALDAVCAARASLQLHAGERARISHRHTSAVFQVEQIQNSQIERMEEDDRDELVVAHRFSMEELGISGEGVGLISLLPVVEESRTGLRSEGSLTPDNRRESALNGCDYRYREERKASSEDSADEKKRELFFGYSPDSGHRTEVSISLDAQGSLAIELLETHSQPGWVREEREHTLRMLMEGEGLSVDRLSVRPSGLEA